MVTQINGTEPVAVLALIPGERDRRVLDAILSRSIWKLRFASSLRDAREKLGQNGFGAVITDADLPGRWKDIVAVTQRMTPSPPVIVVSQVGEERLWAEVLNLGGFDVLLKPFDPTEVLRIVSMAGRNWRDRIVRAGLWKERSTGLIQDEDHRA